MSNNYFQFKQFLVNQENVSMRVNTDGVLLGAWATLPSNATGILDVGTGTGVIALMIAQRLGFQQPHCQIVAIDVDNASCKQAQENFQQSKWSESLVAKHISLQDFNTEKLFDLIISNPPYFNNALKNPSEAKRTARHTDTLSYQDLTNAASKLLKPNGRLSVIIPFDEYPTMQSAIIATNKNLLCVEGLQDSANPAASSKEESSFALRLSRLCKVFTLRQDPTPKRLLLEFTKEQRNARISPKKELVTGGTAGTQTNPAVQEEA
ncbi:MAG: methyltransferase, partial [Bacteroidales bacterium]|nr:methyltransferase [Bacteroidales bacterium]